MMNYPNPYYQQQFQGNMLQQYPTHFINAMQQNYGQQSQQIQQQQQPQSQQQITTQPPIMQPTTNGNKIILVSNKEEATGTAVDLVNGTPSFFYNKSNGEIYLKQFDIPTGKGIFKTYIETIPENNEIKNEPIVHNYDKEINYLIQGVDNLHRMIAQLQQRYTLLSEENFVDNDIEKNETKKKGNSK